MTHPGCHNGGKEAMKRKKREGGVEHKHNCSEAPDSLLMKTFGDTISAGDKLAEAAHRVQSERDGVHRLRLALAEWYTTRANEFGRKKP